jgi:hypothetical protein
MSTKDEARARAKRDYLFAGAVAMAGAVLGIAADSTDDVGTGFGAELFVVAVLAALLYARVAYRLLREGDEDEGPSTERLRKMAVIWLLLAGVLAFGMLRGPFRAFRDGGAGALALRDWLFAAAGAAILAVALVRAVGSFVSKRTGEGIT